MEKKQKDFEKRKRAERKMVLEKLTEKKNEWQERRQKVAEHNQELEDKSVRDYRQYVAKSKRAMKN